MTGCRTALALLALFGAAGLDGCNQTTARERRTDEVKVTLGGAKLESVRRTGAPSQPAPPADAARSPFPADGKIFTIMHKFNDHFAVAILAVVERGKLREAARKDTCNLGAGSKIEIYSMHNEARLTTRVGGSDHHAAGHCHSTLSDGKLPRRNMIGTAGLAPPGPIRRRVMNAAERTRFHGRARADLARILKARNRPRGFKIRLVSRALELGKERFVVVDAKLTPTTKCVGKACWLRKFCGPGSFANSGVLVYRSSGGADPALAFHRVVTPDSADTFRGEVSFVGLLPVGPSGRPWLILFNNGCESWDFDLLAPDGNSWKRRITGGAGTTV